jgi:hypothetical protein
MSSSKSLSKNTNPFSWAIEWGTYGFIFGLVIATPFVISQRYSGYPFMYSITTYFTVSTVSSGISGFLGWTCWWILNF